MPIGVGPRRTLFRAQAPSLFSWGVHDLLADSADWNAETWDMEPGELPRLERTFEILFHQIPDEFGVEVLWVGDEAEEERDVSRRQLLEIARQGKFGTKVRYRVRTPHGMSNH